jgi:hypothetical protein
VKIRTDFVRAAIVFILLGVSVSLLYVPTVEGADEIEGMFVMLTGIAVRDFFSSIQQDKKVAALKEAYNPAPGESFVNEE